MILDMGVDAGGRIVLRFRDDVADCETEAVMSVEEARALVANLEQIIPVAVALLVGGHVSLEEGRA